MFKINLQGATRKINTLLQLAGISTIALEGVIEGVIVSIDSWENPINFLVLQPKTKFSGYPLILGKLWLDTIDAYNNYRAGSMKIKTGQLTKKLVLYTLLNLLLGMILLCG